MSHNFTEAMAFYFEYVSNQGGPIAMKNKSFSTCQNNIKIVLRCHKFRKS